MHKLKTYDSGLDGGLFVWKEFSPSLVLWFEELAFCSLTWFELLAPGGTQGNGLSGGLLKVFSAMEKKNIVITGFAK